MFFQAKDIRMTYQQLRETIEDDDEPMNQILEQAAALSQSVGKEPYKPRTTGRQTHRGNAGSSDDSVEDYYRKNVAVPFLDNIIADLDAQFTGKKIELLL